MIEVEGAALPGLIDAHLHLHWLALGHLEVELGGAGSRDPATRSVLVDPRGFEPLAS